MNPKKTGREILWKGIACLVLLMVPVFVWATPGDQKKTEKENPPPPKSQVQTKQQQQAPKSQVTSQAPKTQPQYQPPKTQPQYQPPKAQPQYQPPKAQPQYQPPKTQPQYQPPKAQPQYQAPKVQPQTQPPPKVLTPIQSQQQIQSLNRNRGMMSGINKNPLPQGQVALHADGSRTISATGGRQYQIRPNGTVASVSFSNGRTANFRPNGSFASVHAGGMQINHGMLGERRIVTVRPDHSQVVSMGPHRGYVERPYIVRNNVTYVQRTYVVNNITYVRVYRTSYYRGVSYNYYVPPYYYHPRFYMWTYNPWPVPIYYRWSWFVAPPPWYAFYGPYFVPAPVYPSAALWLTDFLLAESLRLAYEERREAEANAAAAQAYQAPPPPPPAPAYTTQITPEMKEAIAEEVTRQLAAEQQGATTAPPPPAGPQGAAPLPAQPTATGPEAPPAALDPAQRLFVVSSNLAAPTIDGQECELTPGDLITRLDDTPDNSNKVRVSVSGSKGNDCRVGTTLMVDVNDLQEMHNQFREQMDSGLKNLATNSGQGGLPSAPDTGTSPGQVPLPRPDASVNSALQAQQQQADQTEAQIQQEAAQGGQNYY